MYKPRKGWKVRKSTLLEENCKIPSQHHDTSADSGCSNCPPGSRSRVRRLLGRNEGRFGTLRPVRKDQSLLTKGLKGTYEAVLEPAIRDNKVDDCVVADEEAAAIELVVVKSPLTISAGVTSPESTLAAFWYALPSSETSWDTDIMSQPLDFMTGYAALNAATDWLESSCSKMMRPGDLDPMTIVSNPSERM